MVDMRTIKVAREVGYDTLKGMNALKRAVIRDQEGVTKAHFEVGNPETFMARAAEKNPFVSSLLTLAKSVFPRTFSPEAKTAVDVELQKLGADSGVLKVSALSKDAEGVIAQIDAGFANSASEVGFKVVGSAEKGTKINYSGTISKDFQFGGVREASEELINNIQYKEADGMSEFAMKSDKIGPVRDLNIELTAPTEYMNGIAQLSEGKNFGELLMDYKAMIK